jgi:N-acetylneuraminic acid mutarotase
VLVAGGSYNATELYNPSTGSWTASGKLNIARAFHRAAVLTNGKVLITGGNNDTVTINSAELYDL